MSFIIGLAMIGIWYLIYDTTTRRPEPIPLTRDSTLIKSYKIDSEFGYIYIDEFSLKNEKFRIFRSGGGIILQKLDSTGKTAYYY